MTVKLVAMVAVVAIGAEGEMAKRRWPEPLQLDHGRHDPTE